MKKQQNVAAKSTYYTYTSKSGTKYILYYETSADVKQLVDLAEKHHLRGVALWHAGDEDSAVSAYLKAYR